MGAPEPEADAGPQRALSGAWLWAATALAVAISVFHLTVAIWPFMDELPRNALHFGGFALLAALWTPAFAAARGGALRLVDVGCGLLVLAAALWVGFNESAIYDRGVRLSPFDWAAGVIIVLGALEFTRRAAGPIIPILIILSLGYVAWWGRFMPGVFAFPGLSPETVMFRTLYGDDAMFGTIARISATTVFLFIIFGAFLLRSGAGDFVIALARAAAGRLIGGPGLVAVLASALTGTISGSAVANTASTGVITIPLMKKAGFKPHFAGGVEAAASTGGQLMPPIMGAGAFVMASYTQIPYETIVAVAALPALLYFASVAFFVRIEAKKLGLGPMPGDEITLGQALRKGGASFILPVGVVVGMLLWGFTPAYAAVIGIVATIAASWLTETRMGPSACVEALALGARNMISTAVLLCSVGIVVNVITTAGVGNTFSLMISQWAGGNLLLAIALIALASLVLGMGLPVTAAYIVLATLSAPALAGMIGDAAVAAQIAAGTLPQTALPIVMLGAPEAAAALSAPMGQAEAAALVAGLPLEVRAPLREMVVSPQALTAALLSAHMIIFWLSQDSNVTPPVCLAAFTAAAIAKASPLGTGLASWKLAKGLYIVPVLFAYTPLLSGDPLAALQTFAFAVVGVYGLAAGMEGWMETRLTLPLRAVVFAAGLATVWPSPLWVNLCGGAVVLAALALSLRADRRLAGA
ncbi:TRAP transporter permease [Rubrimonas cliftonensis]|uniref:TRAP transporter, 4TM/12TM fusion protein n=1 Tax=Rubrimonas cliftonensis TaxID=89524 RepID=A0A1H3XP73_9RHOB|nr:TRAP transporter fused permease subunit [Rubrimonas cliftonensis]SEA00394.1 TRAP transporter, 4TM/12TM fusion protein [Rubrimonas cliftonensis]